uniref:Uncharacterized protein n=1 Tax=Trichogramma kaykai TaxID=54128 RepID=A0ABD2WHK1_9HYME
MERSLRLRDDVGKATLPDGAKDNEGRFKWKLVERLLRKGVDPNLTDAEGSTLLHIICARTFGCDGNPVERFLRICDDVSKTALLVDVRDKLGRTPLHLAMLECNWTVAETLLRRGADPTVTDEHGSTPLHTFSETESSFSLPANGSVPTLIESCLGRYVNALDKSGNAPLHLALSRARANLVEWLLSHGADPNLPGWLESTPLHVVCKTSINKDDDDAAVANTIERFFGATDRLNLVLRLDARDRWGQTPLHCAVLHDNGAAIVFLLSRRSDDANLLNGRGKTPLQLAVANFMPDMVDVLVDNGADLSGFVFPSANGIESSPAAVTSANRQLEMARRALTVLERLELKGYRLRRGDVAAMMRLLDEYGAFEAGTDLRLLCSQDETFEAEAKKFNVRQKLTLHELIHSPIERWSKRLTSMSDKMWAKILSKLDRRFGDTCDAHLCEIALRNFCLARAMDPFRALVHRTAKEAPNEVCLLIFEHLSNKDLCNICLAVAALESNEAARSEDQSEDARIAQAPKKRRSKRLSKRARSTIGPMQQQQRAAVKRAVVAQFGRVHNSNTRAATSKYICHLNFKWTFE